MDHLSPSAQSHRYDNGCDSKNKKVSRGDDQLLFDRSSRGRIGARSGGRVARGRRRALSVFACKRHLPHRRVQTSVDQRSGVAGRYRSSSVTPTSGRSIFPRERQLSRPLAETRLRTGGLPRSWPPVRLLEMVADTTANPARRCAPSSCHAAVCPARKPPDPHRIEHREEVLVKAMRPARDELASATVSGWRNTTGGSCPWFDPYGSSWFLMIFRPSSSNQTDRRRPVCLSAGS